MRQRSIHGWAATLLIAVAVALPAIALAQDEQGDPPPERELGQAADHASGVVFGHVLVR